jgi:hypothetical protein
MEVSMKKLLLFSMLIVSSLSISSMSLEDIQQQLIQEKQKLNELFNLKKQELFQEEQIRRTALEEESREDFSVLTSRSMADVARIASHLERMVNVHEQYLALLRQSCVSDTAPSGNAQNSHPTESEKLQQKDFKVILAQAFLPVVGNLINHFGPLAMQAGMGIIYSKLLAFGQSLVSSQSTPASTGPIVASIAPIVTSAGPIMPSAAHSSLSDALLSHWL